MKKIIGFLSPTYIFKMGHEILQGVHDYFAPRGYVVVSLVGGYWKGPEKSPVLNNQLYQDFPVEPFAGFLCHGGGITNYGGNEEVQQWLKRLKVKPVVNLGTVFPGVCNGIMDNPGGIRSLTQYLIHQRGYRRLAFLKGTTGHQEAEERFSSFADTLREEGLSLNPDWIMSGNFTKDLARTLVSQWWPSLEEKPEVLLCVNDLSAVGAMEALKLMGVSVPGTLAVTGFDNFEYAPYTNPPLTTVTQPSRLMGYRGAQVLHEWIDKGVSLKGDFMMPSDLVIRSSCGAGPGGSEEDDLVNVEQEFLDYRSKMLSWQLLGQHMAEAIRWDQLLSGTSLTQEDTGLYGAQFWDREQGACRELFPTSSPPVEASLEEVIQRLESHPDRIHILCSLYKEDLFKGIILSHVDRYYPELGEEFSSNVAVFLSRLESVEQLTRAYEEIDRAEQAAALTHLVTGVAHEINTPLGAALTLSSYIEGQAREAEKAHPESLLLRDLEQHLSSLTKIIKRAGDLIQTFKTLSAGASSEQISSFSLDSIVEGIRYNRKQDFTREEWEVEMIDTLEAPIHSYPQVLWLIMEKLLENSYYHGTLEGNLARVEIRAFRRNQDIVISYRDYGPGVPPEVRDKVFHPFFTTKRGEKHIGLGLAILQNLVTMKLKGRTTLLDPPEGFGIEIQFPEV